MYVLYYRTHIQPHTTISCRHALYIHTYICTCTYFCSLCSTHITLAIGAHSLTEQHSLLPANARIIKWKEAKSKKKKKLRKKRRPNAYRPVSTHFVRAIFRNLPNLSFLLFALRFFFCFVNYFLCWHALTHVRSLWYSLFTFKAVCELEKSMQRAGH